MKKVFLFTFLQNLKSSGIKVTTGIICLLFLLSMPVMNIMNKQNIGGKCAGLKKVLIWDESGLSFSDFSSMKEQEDYKNVTFAKATSDKDVDQETLLVHIKKEEQGFLLRFVVNADGELSEMKVMELSDDFLQAFENERQNTQGLTQSQKDDLNMEIESDVVWLDGKGEVPEEEEDDFSMGKYNLFLVCLVIFILLISFSSESVSNSIVSEKSNKLVENLMLTVPTKDLILGKVLGALAVVGIQIFLFLVCGMISSILSMMIFGFSKLTIPPQLADTINSSTLSGLTPWNVLIALVSFFLGVLFFALLAGLFGAAISKMEDMGEGMKIFNVILILSAYVGLGLKMGAMFQEGPNPVENIVGMIPFCAPFLVPVNLLTGKTTVWLALLAVAIQILAVLLLMKLVISVYHTLLLYKGNIVKLRTIIGIARGKGENQ